MLHEASTHLGLLEHVGEQVVEVDDLDSARGERRREGVVLLPRPADPEHAVEEQLSSGRGCEPLQLESGPVQHHPSQPADL